MNITVTTSAQEKIAEMCVENDMVGIRAFISGGGCAGLQHGLGFLEIIEDKDTLVAPNFYVDPVAMSYLDGSTIDNQV
jgi:Fe-S cluster assembly iron-binding protein IscA